MGIETERKFQIDPNAPVPDLSPTVIAGERRTHHLRAVYFDTPDLLLARNSRTLRRRSGGSDAGWHLKLPADGDSRHEIHHDLTQGPGSGSVPRELRARVADIIGYAPLQPVVELVTARQETDLQDADGEVIALLCDDTVAATRGTKTKSWRELEVELTGKGTVADLDAIAEVLIEHGIAPSESVSKLVQSLGKALVRAEESTSMSRKASAADVVGAYIATQVGVLQGREGEVRTDEPDSVHKMRVAARRLRSILRTYRPILDTPRTNAIRLELKWLGEALGGPRDAEVLRGRLVEAVGELPPDALVGPVVERITSELHERHQRAHAELVTALDSERFGALLDSLVGMLTDPPFTDVARARAKGLLPEMLEQVGRKTMKEWRHSEKLTGDAQLFGWHETRKRAKAARYAWEAAIPALDLTATTAAEAWEQVTESLGIVQDATVAREQLLELAAVATEKGESAFSYGVLYQREIDRTADFHSQAVSAIEYAREVSLPG